MAKFKDFRTEKEIETEFRKRILHFFAHHKVAREKYIVCHLCYIPRAGYGKTASVVIDELVCRGILQRVGMNDEYLKVVEWSKKDDNNI